MVGLLKSSSHEAMYSFLVLGGISETGRYYVAYVYATEIVPKRLQSLTGLCIFMTFAACKVIICLYFMLSESKNWEYLAYTALTFAAFSLVMTTVVLPESPRFLYSKKNFIECQKILLRIQKINSVNLNYQFSIKETFLNEPIDDEDYQTSAFPMEPRKYSIASEKDINAAQNEKKIQGTFKELIQFKVYRCNLIVMMVIWSFGSFAFFMVPYYLSSIKNTDIYLMSIATELAEFLASVLCVYITRIMDL